jgi:hypothetical protein
VAGFAIVALTQQAFAAGPARKARQIALQNAWSECLTTFARRAAQRTSEPVEILVRGAFSECQKNEDTLYRFYIHGMPKVWSDFVQNEFFPAVKKGEEDRMIATILKARS